MDCSDSDNDMIADCADTCIDADGDGTVDLDLPAMGADPQRKDIFVEIGAALDLDDPVHSVISTSSTSVPASAAG